MRVRIVFTCSAISVSILGVASVVFTTDLIKRLLIPMAFEIFFGAADSLKASMLGHKLPLRPLWHR